MAVATLAAATAVTARLLSGDACVRVEGYLVNWDLAGGTSSAQQAGGTLARATTVWHATQADGTVSVPASMPPEGERAAALRALEQRGVAVLAGVQNFREGSWRGEEIGALVGDESRRQQHVRELLAVADSGSYSGISLDYELVPAASREGFTALVRELADALHAAGKTLTVAVPAKTADGGEPTSEAYDYAALAVADQLMVMAYDEHWPGSGPGPIASAPWVRSVLAYATERVDADRLALGVAAYAYDWTQPPPGAVRQPATSSTVAAALQLAEERGAEVTELPGAGKRFTYEDDRGATHVVHIAEASSAAAAAAEAARTGVAAVNLWRLGAEDPATWAALDPVSCGETTPARAAVAHRIGDRSLALAPPPAARGRG